MSQGLMPDNSRSPRPSRTRLPSQPTLKMKETRAPPSTGDLGGALPDSPPQNSPSHAKRSLRKRKSEPSQGDRSFQIETVIKPLTDDERHNWKGWVELESDPTLFNYILREYGVMDVKVQEVLGLDDEMLAFLPKPVYGLIFLFRYRDEDETVEAEGSVKCPKHVWFANQTTHNACATIALLNIVMNVPEINLGDTLAAFKDTTQDLRPAYRGRTLSRNGFIRSIHNSFARRMDMLNSDLALKNEYDEWKKPGNKPKRQQAARKPAKGKGKGKAKVRGKTKKKEEEEAAYHYIAYVPINGTVWRLDGLQQQPINLGEAGLDWVNMARSNIRQRISQYDEDGVQFNLLSLCKSPLQTIPGQLAENTKSIDAVETSLATIAPDWRAFLEGGDDSSKFDDLSQYFGVSMDLLEKAEVPTIVEEKIKHDAVEPGLLMEFRKDLVEGQAALQGSYMEEVALVGQETEQAVTGKVDHTPLIYESMKTLAESGALKQIVVEIKKDRGTQKI